MNFFGNNLKWKLIFLLIFHNQSHFGGNSVSRVMDQNADSQSSEKHLGQNWFFTCI